MAQKDNEKDQKPAKAGSDKKEKKGQAGKKAAAPKAKTAAPKGKKKAASPVKTKADSKQTVPAKKKAAPKKTAVAKKADKPAAAKKASKAKSTKSVSARDILFRRFNGGKPEKLYTPKKIKPSVSPSPPFVETDDPKVTAQIRELLFKRFDRSTPAVKKVDAGLTSVPDEPAAKPSTPTPQPSIAEAPAPVKEEDPAGKMIKLGILVLAVLILVVSGASRLNMQKFYLSETDGALEIWKGTFSPSGTEQMIILPGVPMPAETKPVYKKEDVYPLIYQFYLDKADALLTVPGMPDFEGVKGYLNQAIAHGTTGNPPTDARQRLNRIDALILTLKADAAAARGTMADLQEANLLLKKASRIEMNEAEAAVITEKIAAVDTALAALQAPEKAPEPPADALEAE